MAGKDIVMATQEELKALHVIHKAIDKVIRQKDAAEILNLSERQVRRKAKRIREEGDKGIVHRARGNPSNRAVPDKIKDKILSLFKNKYSDFGPTLAAEKLFERDKVKINDETLRKWLIEKAVPYKERKKRPHRQWRERKERFGQMIQIDGSNHNWFEKRGPKCVLMGYIDDSTGIPYARFYEYEGTLPAMDSFKSYIERYGIPHSVYLDKHSTYKSTKKPTIEDELNNVRSLSQFERALEELTVLVIHADSPQAKGRIERLFRTFQDRIIKEMRLEGIKTIKEANRFLEGYLPIYAKRFAVLPAEKGDLHRPLPKDIDLDRILCVKTEHSLRNDFTVIHKKKFYQIYSSVTAKKVTVEERVDGSMVIRHKDDILRFKQITRLPKKQSDLKKIHKMRKIRIPPMDHPWKQPTYESYQHINSYAQREKGSQKEKGLLLL